MKVSFVVPIYKKPPNSVRFALKSLKTQSHEDIEVICVFDGKDEELENVSRETIGDDKRFSIHTIEHGGAPKARNYGFTKSTGDVVAFWDADCYAEPEMTKVWVMTFEKNPNVDFVYSGYRWSDTNVPGFQSEKFDPWILGRYNYIASMFPIKRGKFPGWDESLEGLQDWDYWRRAVDAGCVGKFIPGFGFSTDLPDSNSISGNSNRTKERVKVIRDKFKDAKKDILVVGSMYKNEAVHIAKVLNADYFAHWQFYKVDDYRLILMVGLHPDELGNYSNLLMATPNEKKALYWMGHDSEATYCGPYYQVKVILDKVRDRVKVHFCEGERTRKILSDLGIEAEILPYPADEGVPMQVLPEKFKVLALADEQFKEHLDSIVKALPMIEIVEVKPEQAYNILDYTVGMQLTSYPRLVDSSRKMVINGRYLISNIQEPFGGFVDTNDVTKFKNEVVERILELEKTKEINRAGQDYYLAAADRVKFTERIESELRIPLEVVA